MTPDPVSIDDKHRVTIAIGRNVEHTVSPSGTVRVMAEQCCTAAWSFSMSYRAAPGLHRQLAYRKSLVRTFMAPSIRRSGM